MYKIMSNNLGDLEAIKQIEEIDRIFSDNNIVIMPDYHAGKGCVVGTTMLITDRACPNHVGVDIGCGIAGYRIDKRYFKFDNEKLKELDSVIRKNIPSGTLVNRKKSKFIPKGYEIKLRAKVENQAMNRAYLSLGTLGGGNHFIEVGENEDSYILFIHSGSRNLGVQVANYHQNIAIDTCNKERVEYIYNLTKKVAPQEREKMMKKYIEENPHIPNQSCYLRGDYLEDYLFDMRVMEEFACLNREIMIKTILEKLGIPFVRGNYIESTHNYIEDYKGVHILRKGATSAKKDERVIIPLNMRDGIIIGTGKGNKEWNYSAPHGAGRILSRKQAKENLSLDEFRETMKGIFTTCVSNSTLDESPMAYKPVDEILEVIGDTIDIEEIVKPIYNFKAS